MTDARAKKLVIEVTRAHSDLHIYAAIVALLESSLVSSDSFHAQNRIITICKSQQAKCLAKYDRARASLETST